MFSSKLFFLLCLLVIKPTYLRQKFMKIKYMHNYLCNAADKMTRKLIDRHVNALCNCGKGN